MTPEGEAELARAAAGGSSAAFARLVALHQGAVRGFLRRLSGGHADADDLAQDAFMTAWGRIGAFRPGESLRAWLCGIAYRKWLTHRRAQGRRAMREAEAAQALNLPLGTVKSHVARGRARLLEALGGSDERS